MTAPSSLLRIIARGVEVGQCGGVRNLSRLEIMNLARNYCDANGLSYARGDLKIASGEAMRDGDVVRAGKERA